MKKTLNTNDWTGNKADVNIVTKSCTGLKVHFIDVKGHDPIQVHQYDQLGMKGIGEDRFYFNGIAIATIDGHEICRAYQMVGDETWESNKYDISRSGKDPIEVCFSMVCNLY